MKFHRHTDPMADTGTATDEIWRARGLSLLFGFGVANCLAAFISFIAFNWTYLANATKLGGLAAFLVVAVGVWVWRQYDSQIAIIAGVCAQLLIGAWLAAAGQLYQAPGGLQDLMLYWACLGLPFALASRSQIHWAIWFSVVFLFAVSPIATLLSQFLDRDSAWVPPFVAALVAASGWIMREFWHENGWLNTFLGGLTALLLIISASSIWQGIGYGEILALVSAVSLAVFAVKKKQPANAIILSAATGWIIFLMLVELLEGSLPDILTFAILAAYVIGFTYALVRLSRVILKRSDMPSDQEEQTPWYVSAIAGAGGLISAILIGAILGAFIALIPGLDQYWEMVTLIFGVSLWVTSVLIQRKKAGPFLATLSAAFIVASVGMIVFGVTGLISTNSGNEPLVAGILAIALSLVTAIVVSENGVLHGVMALIAIIGLASVTYDLFGFGQGSHATLILTAALILSGLIFAIRSKVWSARLHISAVFWVVALCVQVPDIWFQQDRVMLSIAASFFLMATGLIVLFAVSDADERPSIPVLVASLLASFLLPSGAAAALLLTLFGYTFRRLPLFGLGAAGFAVLLLYRYIDIELDLLAVSAIMVLVGGLFLSVWWLSQRRLAVAS